MNISAKGTVLHDPDQLRYYQKAKGVNSFFLKIQFTVN